MAAKVHGTQAHFTIARDLGSGGPRGPEPRGNAHFLLKTQAHPLIDCGPWQDRRPYPLGLTQSAPPRYRQKNYLLNGIAGGSVTAPRA